MKKKQLIKKDLFFKVKDIDEEKYIIRGVFSTEDKDRHGEIIDQAGWKLDSYMENPVVLFAHDQWVPAVGQMIELAIDSSKKLIGAIKFAAEEHDLAKTLFNLYKGRYMRAFSVGFMNKKEEIEKDNDGEEHVVLKENILYEVSCVNVPANAMALATGKGINTKSITDAIKKSEKEKEIILSEKTIKKISETLYQKIQKNISADKAKTKKKIKVETPLGEGGKKRLVSKKFALKKFASVKQINKAIRELLTEKQKINY